MMDPAQAHETRLLERNKTLQEVTVLGDSEVQQFYNGATVFITGGTGFIGKQLIEKLLRATNVSKIFILMRSKKGIPIQEGLHTILKDPVFDLVRNKKPSLEQRLVSTRGNITELKLGMSDDDWKMVTEQVEIIFHVAATTRFDEVLRVATLTNVQGTREAIKLGTECKKLRSFVHVSTAYSCAKPGLVNKQVVEDFYPSPVNPESLINIVKTVDEDILNNITPNFIKGWPNTYAFTKAVSEELVRTMDRQFPICIIRPTIVICALREPSPGWLDMYICDMYVICQQLMEQAMIVATGLGVQHVLYMDQDIKIDLVPVDYVNNAIIVTGWETAKKRVEEVKIYTIAATRNVKTWGTLHNKLKTLLSDYAVPGALSFSYSMCTANPVFFFIYMWIMHIIPAYIVDGILLIMGKKRIAVKLSQKAYTMAMIMSYFTTNQWNFDDKNLLKVYEELSSEDKQIFDFDVMKIDWNEYMTSWGLGVRKYIFKDNLNGTNYGKKKRRIFFIIMLLITPLYFYVLYKIIYLFFMVLFYIFNYLFVD